MDQNGAVIEINTAPIWASMTLPLGTLKRFASQCNQIVI
jgi:hypothetical protein